jgi:beta-lactam-binding protein with PASTA domain
VLAVAVVAAGCHEDRPVTVPDLVGMPQPEAQKALERLGLRWRFGGSGLILTRAPKPLPPGSFIYPDPYEDPVVSQDPESGEHVSRGELIDLETRCTMLRFKNSGCY